MLHPLRTYCRWCLMCERRFTSALSARCLPMLRAYAFASAARSALSWRWASTSAWIACMAQKLLQGLCDVVEQPVTRLLA